jgi:T5SS/PEP-CTERM-associated repeat protein
LVDGRIQSAGAACASDCWTGATSADWFVGANWTAGVPTANTAGTGTDAIVDQGSPNTDPTIGINTTSNAATSSTVVIGDVAGATGALSVSTTNASVPASLTITGSGQSNVIPLLVGGSGTGFLTITNGGSVVTTGGSGGLGNVVIGFASTGTGTVTIGSATAPDLTSLSTLTNNAFNPGSPGTLIVGDSGTGTLIINPDGAVSGFLGVTLGQSTGGQGTAIVNGGSLDTTNSFFSGLGQMQVGLFGVGTLTIENGGTVTSAAGVIAIDAGSTGSGATVTGAGSIWNINGGVGLGYLTVGGDAVGSLAILSGGTVEAENVYGIGIGPLPNTTGAGAGTLTVDNGSLIAYGTPLYVGLAGGGSNTMTVRNGGRVVTDGGQIGGDAPASFTGSATIGVVTVTGAGSVWDAARDSSNAVDATSTLYVDNQTSMTGLFIQLGGKVINGSGYVSDFSANGVVNTVEVTDAGSTWTNLTSLNVGYFNTGFSVGSSTGVVTISNGGLVSAPSINIGVLPDGSASNVDTITVSGAGSSLQASGTLAVGLFGSGNLVVSGGATVTSGAGVVGYSSAAPGSLSQTGVGLLDTGTVGANSVGTVTITGAGSIWTTGSLIVGDNTNTDTSGTFTGIGGGTASGTLTIANGGAVSSTSAIQVALNAGSTGTINIGAPDGQVAAAPGTISAPAIVFGSGTGTIVFNHTSTNYVFGIPLQGQGAVIVDSGTTIFTADNTYTGPTTINGGTLEVNGTIANTSGVTVNAGGTLSGTGTVDPLPTTTIANNATLAPGSAASPTGTLNIGGSLTFQSAALYLISVGGARASSTDVTGSAALGGTVKVQLVSAPGAKSYDILHATGGLGGTTFAGVVAPNFDASLSYTTTDVFLNLTAVLGTGTPLNQNQQNVANAINSYFNTVGSLPPGFGNVFNLSGAPLQNALTQLDGEVATDAVTSTFTLMDEFLELMQGQISGSGSGSGTSVGLGFAPGQQAAALPSEIALAYDSILKAPPKQSLDQRWSVWGAGFGGNAAYDGNATVGSNNVSVSTYGTAAGMEYRADPRTVYGFTLAGSGLNWGLAQGLGTGSSNALQVGVYGKTYWGAAYLSGALAFGNNWFSTNRTALGDRLAASFTGQSYAARGEFGYRYTVPVANALIGATPYGALQTQWFYAPAYGETDLSGGGLGLSYASTTANDTRSEFGARFDDLTTLNNKPLILGARLAWAHDWTNGTALNAVFESLPGSAFTVNGAPLPRDSALTSASAQYFFTPALSFTTKFDGEFAPTSQTYAGSGTLKYAW